MSGVAALAILAALAAGCVIALVPLRRMSGGRARPGLALACAPGVGLGLLSVLYFFTACLGVDPVLAWVALVGLALLALAALRRKPGGGPRPGPSARRGTAFWLAHAALLVTSIGAVFSFVRWSAATPLGTFDAIAIWNAHAVLFHRAPVDYPAILARLQSGHPDYPLFLPGAIAAQYALAGEQLRVSQLTGLSLLMGLGFVTYAAVGRTGSRTAAAVATALLLGTPEVWRQSFSQCADLPVAYFVAASGAGLASLLDERRERRVPPELVGLFLGLLIWTKNEGTVLALVLVVPWLAVQLSRGRLIAERRTLAWLLAGALPGLLATLWFKASWSPFNEMGHFLDGALERLLVGERWSTVSVAFLEQFSPLQRFGSWGLLWPLLLVGLILSARKLDLDLGYLPLVGVLSLLAYAAVYLITPQPLAWHLRTSLARLLFQLLPLLVIAVFTCAATPRAERPLLGRMRRESPARGGRGAPAAPRGPSENRC